MKRITSSLLALLLALSMLIGMVPAAYAAPADTIESIDSTETVDSSETEDVSDESEDIAAYAADTELTDYVVVGGIKGFEGKQFATFEAAYNAIKPVMETLGLGEDTYVSTEDFDALFTDVTDGKATLTYTITGNVTYDETGLDHLLTMGRKTSHYLTNERHLINFKFKSETPNRGAILTVNSNITLPYEWWGEKVTTSISFENLTITGSAPNGLDATQPYFEGIDFTIDNCTLRGIKVYNCSNVGGKYTITNSTLDGTGAPVDAYAIHLQGNESAPLTIKIDNNQISGYDRGINIDQNTAVAEITNNEISIEDNGRSCIQLSRLAKTTVSGNELALTGGNAITLHELLLETGAVPEITVTGNTITGNGYLIYDDAVANGKAFTSDKLTFKFDSTNTVASTVDKEKGVKGGNTYDLSQSVESTVNGTSTTGVAKVGETPYATLDEAFGALTSTDYTLTLLNESVWNTATPVYWAAGTQKGYAATLTAALTEAYKANADNIKIVCRPGADVGTMTHGHVADDITIYGNDAYISGGECDLEVDTYMFSRETGKLVTADGAYLDKNITITAYELDNLGVWGERHTAYTVNVNLTDCDGKAIEGKPNVQRVYISGTTGKNEITLKNCDFITAATAVYSNADGAIMIDRCSFTDSKVPVNFNHKANGVQSLTVSNSTFTNCGDDGDWKQFAAPVRFVNSGSGTQNASVDSCTFTNTVGINGDILLGDGRTGQKSNDVTLTVTNTKATVQAQKPGYYNGAATDKNNGAEMKVESGETLNTSVEEMLPTALTAYVTVNGGTEQYATLDEAIAAAEPENGVITYTVTGKVNANGESWIQVAKAGLTGLTEVKFVGADENAEICITNSTAVLADQSYDIDVSFKDLTLSHPNGAWVGDLGHATNYFTTVLRNTDAANNTVSYTNCTFPNGACNNQYGKTVYDNCQFKNEASGLYNLWNYGGNTEIKNSTFTGTRGIKAYSEGTDGGDISISGTTFDDLNEKAAIVASKPVGIVLDNVAVTGASSKGLFTRDISGKDELTISATGTGISGKFNITSDATGANAKEELNISAGTFNSEVSNDYCADGFEVKANGDGTYGVAKAPAAKIGDTAYETLDAAIAAANDGDTIIVNAGEYKLNGSLTYTGKAFTIKAADGAKVSFDMSAAVALHGAKITFENVTFDYKTNGNYIGMQHTDTLVYNSCTINGQAFLYATNETFNKCKFNQSSNDAYNVWTYGAKNVAFNSCTFNCAGKSVLVYNEGSNEQTDLTVTDTQFNASETVNGKAAIEIDTSLMNGGATVIVDDKSTATGFSNETTDKAGLWNVKKKSLENNKVLDVTVAGEKVYSLPVAVIGTAEYPTITAAITAAADGDTVKLLADTTEDVVINKDITLDLGGKTLTNTNAGKATISVTGGTVTVKNGNVVGGTSYYNIEVTKGSNANLTLEGVTATAGNTGSSMIDNYGTLTITSGEYSGGLNVVKSEEGSTLTITGGTFTLEYATNGYTGVVFAYGDTTISGGEFIQNLTTTGRWNHPTVILTGVVEGYTAITRVTGGHFVNKMSGESIFRGVGKGTSDNFEVSGGTFNKSISEDFCADGFIPTKNADGTYGVKEGKYVAKVGRKNYETLADAIRLAANGNTITLLANVTENVEISKGKRVTLDLNGYTLNGGTGTAKAALTNYGTITIKDSSAAKTGTIKRDDNGTVGETSYYVIRNQGTMTIESGTVINNSGYRKANSTGSMVGSSLICNGDCDEGGTLTIKGGTFTQNNFIAIKNGALGVLNVTGGTITSNHSAIQNWFKADITGGEIKGQLWTDAWKEGESVGETQIGGDAKFTGEIVMDITGSVAPTLAINGGNLDVTNWRITSAAANAGAKPAVSGGTFSRAVKEEYCAPGYVPTQNGDGTYGVKEGAYVAEVNGTQYESLQAAINAAPKSGTVKLLADTRENVTIDKMMTLDLNGHTLNGGTEKGKPALTITARTVTIKDSSAAQTGTIMREDTAENSGVSSHYVIDIQGNAWVMFESGNVKNNSGNTAGKGASLVRVGDDSVEKYPGLNIKGGTFTQDNFIVIKVDRGDLFLNGGTLNSKNSYAIENWHRATIKGGTVNGAVSSWTYGDGSNSTLEINGGTVNGNVEAVSYDGAEGKLAKVEIKGGTVNGTLSTKRYGYSTTDPAKATIEVTAGTFSQDPSKYLVEGSTVTNNSDGTFGVEKAYLAQVGENSYYTIDEAFKAQTASGKPIVLLRDYTTGSTFNSGTINRTVDLNGHTWTCTGTDANSAAFEINNPNVTLTVKNGKIVSSQLVGLIPSAMGGTIKYDNSGLVFEGVEMSTTATSGIETNGSNTNDSVTLRNSTLNVPDGFGIYFPSSGKLTIENSTINAKTMGVQVCAGSLKISGEGTAITVTGDAVPKTENDGAIQDGAAISIVNRKGYKGLVDVTITGGTFKANGTNAAVKAYDWENNKETNFTESSKVSISGGTFSAEVPADLCAPGYVPKDNGDGTYGVKKGTYVAAIGEKKYATLAAAVDAAQNGDTITLLADVEQNTMLVIKKDITLDLAGKKIFNTTDIWSDANGSYELLSIEAKVTITGNGTIDAKENDCYTINVKNGNLTIENGTFYGNISVVQVEKGTLTINGGKFDLHQKWKDKNTYLINCIDDAFVAKTAKVAIYGGEFVDFDPNVSPEKKIDGKTPSFAAPGVGITKNENNTFTAKPNMVAQIVDADGNSVAAYASLAEAVATAKDNEIVKLLADTDISTTGLTITETITLDLNGYTIEAANTDNGNIKVYGKLTLTDGTDTKKDGTGKGKITTNTAYASGTTDKVLIAAMGGGTFIMESGLIDAASFTDDNANNGQFAVSVQNDTGDAAVIINGGHIKAGWYAVAGNGTNTTYNGNITVNGGILESTADYAIYHPHTGTTTINGGTIYGAAGGVSLNRGKLVVNGGTITSKGTGSTGDWGDGTGKQDAAAINVNAQYDSTSVEIKGGTITAENDAILLTNGRNGTIAVSGGQFSHEVKAEYCAIGYQPKTTQDPNTKLYTVEKVNGNAYYVDDSGKPVYGNFVDLVNYTNDATVNKTITLLDNVTVNGYMLLFEGRSVDLSGFELTITKKLIANDGSVSDSSDGKGLLKIAADSATLVSNNGQIPLYDTENQGYRLFNCTIKDALQTISNTSVKLWVGAIFTNKDAYKLLRTGNEHNIKIVVTLRWKNSQDTAGEQTFAFTQSLINKVALTNGEDAFYIVLTGLDTDLTGSISEVTAQGGITSGTGVSISGEEYTLTK